MYERGLIKLESKLRKELEDVLYQEELLWYQKAKAEWIKDGDRNTSFFHLSTVVKQWKNKISAIKDERGVWIHDKEEVKHFIMQYFKDLFTAEYVMTNTKAPTNMFPSISEYDWWKLTREFTVDEIYEVVKHMGSIKAPGPDGFQALFYQKCWNTVAPSVCRMVMNALKGKGLPPTLNNTFLVLIPKVDVPETPR